MNAIGGYFGLELRNGEHYHKNAYRLNTARNCFEYVLRARHYKKVYIPYYTCEVMLEPIKKLNIEYVFYNINKTFEPFDFPKLEPNDAFLYTNYFGLKQSCVQKLSKIYGSQLIVDNAQAFFAEPIDEIDTFYSARKFFGVPDGAYLYTNCRLQNHDNLQRDISHLRMSHLLKRIDVSAEEGYHDFRQNDDSLDMQDIKLMSSLTEKLLESVDYEFVKNKRKENYNQLEFYLKDSNLLHLKMDNQAIPMIYPYLTNNQSLKQRLIKNRIFIPTYWRNVLDWVSSCCTEYVLVNNLLTLPIDQRYDEYNMLKIKKIISNI